MKPDQRKVNGWAGEVGELWLCRAANLIWSDSKPQDPPLSESARQQLQSTLSRLLETPGGARQLERIQGMLRCFLRPALEALEDDLDPARPVQARWVGRQVDPGHQPGQRRSKDLLIEATGTADRLGVDLKFVDSGPGTIRNPGGQQLQKLFGLSGDLEAFQQEMYRQVAEATDFPPPDKELTAQRLKKYCRQDPDRRQLAARVGQNYADGFVDALVQAYGELSARKRQELLRWVLGLDEDSHTLLFNRNRAYYFSNGELLEQAGPLTLAPDSGQTERGLKFLWAGTPLFRLSISCTSGLGCSSLCGRFTWLQYQKLLEPWKIAERAD